MTQGHLELLDSEAVLTYLFLCAVGNSDGVSFWGRSRISRVVHLPETAIAAALVRLQQARLIVFRERVVQVLPVPEEPVKPPTPAPHPQSQVAVVLSGAGGHSTPAAAVTATVEPEELLRHEDEARQRLRQALGRMPSEAVVKSMALGLAQEARRQRTEKSGGNLAS